MRALAIVLLLATVALGQQQYPSGSSSSGGGGQIQVRNSGGTSTDVGFAVGNLFLPAVLQTGGNVIGSISNTSFQVSNFPSTYDISDRSGRLLGLIANTSFQVSNFPASQAVTGTFFQSTQPVSSLQLPAALDGSGFLKTHEQGTAAASIADGSDVTLGAKADAKNAATDATPITLMQVLKEISFMEQTPASRAVTQGTSPWVSSVTLWGGGTLGAMANYGTSPGAVLVPGVNAFVTNFPASFQVSNFPATQAVTQSTSPWVVSCSTANCPQPTLTKGTQGATGFSTQDLKDAGRSRIAFTADAVAVATTEGLITFTKNVAGTATTAQTTYTVTAGKTFRTQAISVSLTASSTTVARTRVRLRENTGGACTASSALVWTGDFGPPPGTLAAGIGYNAGPYEVTIPDGFEFPAADSLCLSEVATTNTTALLSLTLLGYEY